MIQFRPDLLPILVAAFMVAIIWFLRTQNARKSATRLQQLRVASECLDKHATALAQILDDPHAPIDLKRLAISVSDAMGDRIVAQKIAAWVSTRPIDQPLDTEDTRAIDAMLAPLRSSRPDLIEAFSMTVVTAVASASLRWPESTILFEQVFPRLMTTPRRDVAIAATAASLRSNGPFSLRPVAPVLA